MGTTTSKGTRKKKTSDKQKRRKTNLKRKFDILNEVK